MYDVVGDFDMVLQQLQGVGDVLGYGMLGYWWVGLVVGCSKGGMGGGSGWCGGQYFGVFRGWCFDGRSLESGCKLFDNCLVMGGVFW